MYIHPLLWLVVAIGILTGHFIELVILLLIIFIHEMGHAVCAVFFSWRLKKIALLPFGGVAEVDEYGNRPIKEELLVTIFGPLQHLWLFALGVLLHQFHMMSDFVYQYFMMFNFMVLIFNLLPIWPLDGGKLLFILLSIRYPFNQAFHFALFISTVVLALFMIISLYFEPMNINVWIVSSFLMFSLYIDWRQRPFIFVRFLLERYYGKEREFKKLKPIVVDANEEIMDVFEKFQRGYKHPIIVERNGKESGSLDENELLHAYFSQHLVSVKVGELLYYL